MVRAEQWFQANITGFGHEPSTETDGEITHPGVRGTDVHKLVGKAGPGMHFQQDLREIHPRQPCRDVQGDEARGLLQFVEVGDDQLLAPRRTFEAHGGLVWQVCQGLLIRHIKLGRQ